MKLNHLTRSTITEKNKFVENHISKEETSTHDFNIPFYRACFDCNLDEIEKFIEQGADIHSGDEFALFQAFSSRNIKVAKWLLEHGADANKVLIFALQASYDMKSYKILDMLVNHHAKFKPHHCRLVLLEATRDEDQPFVEYLFRILINQKLSCRDLLYCAFLNKNMKMLENIFDMEATASDLDSVILPREFDTVKSETNKIETPEHSLDRNAAIFEYQRKLDGDHIFHFLCHNIKFFKFIVEHSNNKEILYKKAFQFALDRLEFTMFVDSKTEWVCIKDSFSLKDRYVYIKLIMFLLKEGANYKEFMDRVSHFVILFGKMSDFKKLYEKYGFDKITLLNYGVINSAIFGRKSIAKYCVKNGADVNALDGRFFYAATEYCQLNILEFLIKKGAHLRTPNFNANSPVYHKKGIAVIKLLIKHGFDIHEEQDKVLRDACVSGNTKMVKYLVNQGADLFIRSPETTTEAACRGGRLDVLKYLLAKGVNLNIHFKQSLNNAVYYNHVEIIQYLVSHVKNLRSVLSSAIASVCDYSSSTLVQALLDNGISRKEIESEALYFCLCRGYIVFADRLIAMGFDIHSDDDRLFQNLCLLGDIKVLNYLLSKGANLHAGNEGGLCYACEAGLFNVVLFLIEAGADLHVNNDEPLKLACSAKRYQTKNLLKGVKVNDHFLIVKYLVAKGANTRNDNGSILLAACSGRDAQLNIVKYLVSKGANVNLVKDQLLFILKGKRDHKIYHYILNIVKEKRFH